MDKNEKGLSQEKELTQKQINTMHLGQLVTRIVEINVALAKPMGEFNASGNQPESANTYFTYCNGLKKELGMYMKALDYKEEKFQQNSSNVIPW